MSSNEHEKFVSDWNKHMDGWEQLMNDQEKFLDDCKQGKISERSFKARVNKISSRVIEFLSPFATHAEELSKGDSASIKRSKELTMRCEGITRRAEMLFLRRLGGANTQQPSEA